MKILNMIWPDYMKEYSFWLFLKNKNRKKLINSMMKLYEYNLVTPKEFVIAKERNGIILVPLLLEPKKEIGKKKKKKIKEKLGNECEIIMLKNKNYDNTKNESTQK